MTEAERQEAFELYCRKSLRFPKALTQALVQYMQGQGSLDPVRQEWQAALRDNRPPYLVYPYFSKSDQDLDALDLRALDLYRVTETPDAFLYKIARQVRIKAAFDYLLGKGATQQQVRRWALRHISYAVNEYGVNK